MKRMVKETKIQVAFYLRKKKGGGLLNDPLKKFLTLRELDLTETATG